MIIHQPPPPQLREAQRVHASSRHVRDKAGVIRQQIYMRGENLQGEESQAQRGKCVTAALRRDEPHQP